MHTIFLKIIKPTIDLQVVNNVMLHHPPKYGVNWSRQTFEQIDQRFPNKHFFVGNKILYKLYKFQSVMIFDFLIKTA